VPLTEKCRSFQRAVIVLANIVFVLVGGPPLGRRNGISFVGCIGQENILIILFPNELSRSLCPPVEGIRWGPTLRNSSQRASLRIAGHQRTPGEPEERRSVPPMASAPTRPFLPSPVKTVVNPFVLKYGHADRSSNPQSPFELG